MKRFTDKYITPDEKDPDKHARIVVLSWILCGSIVLAGSAFGIALHSLIVRQRSELAITVLFLSLIFFFFVTLYRLVRTKRFVVPISFVVVLLFGGLGLWVLSTWTVINPTGLLVVGLSIVMASILLGARQSLYITGLYAIAIPTLHVLSERDVLQPNKEWVYAPIAFSDALSFSILLLVISLVSWLFNKQMEESLHRARRSEVALKRQKDLLEIRVEERTRELEALQVEKMQQFYRFAELGRLSTALFHDLSNHLTTINLDLEGLRSSDQSKNLLRLQQNATYIDDVITRVRKQLLGKEEVETFNIRREVVEIIEILKPKATQNNVSMHLHIEGVNKNILTNGSLTRFRQMVINIISNAIDAYENSTKSPKPIHIAVSTNKKMIAITVTDKGCGIPAENQIDIFKPFYSSKHDGVGIGLFIVKQIVEQYFHGQIEVVSAEDIGSTFTVKIPKKLYEPAKKTYT
jgi:signal transduction histidine kinase